MAGAWLETRTSLIRGLRNPDDAETWQTFVDAYGRVMFAVATKAGLPVEDARDVTQDTLIAVARRIQGFDPDPGRGSFKAWLLTIARSRIADWFRRQQRQRLADPPPPTSTTDTPWLARVPDPAAARIEELYEAEWRETIYRVARERVREHASPRQYQIFDLHVLHEHPVAQVAAELGITPNQVYVAKHRIGEAIAREVARLERGEQPGGRTPG